MNPTVKCKDQIKLIEVKQDGWGDYVVSKVVNLLGLFVQGTSQSYANSTEMIGTDAHCYLDVTNPYVLANAHRLEGMYIVANIFNGKNKDFWFKILSVKVGQRKLLGNEVNNVHCFLSKSSPIEKKEDGVEDF